VRNGGKPPLYEVVNDQLVVLRGHEGCCARPRRGTARWSWASAPLPGGTPGPRRSWRGGRSSSSAWPIHPSPTARTGSRPERSPPRSSGAGSVPTKRGSSTLGGQRSAPARGRCCLAAIGAVFEADPRSMRPSAARTRVPRPWPGVGEKRPSRGWVPHPPASAPAPSMKTSPTRLPATSQRSSFQGASPSPALRQRVQLP
jgi:hypothetical protein